MTALRQLKWVKCGIGCLIMMMMLGAASFSIQALAGTFQPNDAQYCADASSGIKLDQNSPDGSLEPAGADLSASADSTDLSHTHSMDNRPETNGFQTVPWISVSFIRQALKEASTLRQERKLLRTFTNMAYPSYRTIGVTDRTIRSLTNSNIPIQAFALHISKLTAS